MNLYQGVPDVIQRLTFHRSARCPPDIRPRALLSVAGQTDLVSDVSDLRRQCGPRRRPYARPKTAQCGLNFQPAWANATTILLTQSFTDSLLVSSTTRLPVQPSSS